ncbi:MAG: hypothetical protein ACLP9S_12030 [Syntrophales bacterium]
MKALKEILGHKDIKMTMRYSHLSKEFAREEIQILNGLTSAKNKKVASAETDQIESVTKVKKDLTLVGQTLVDFGGAK